MASASLKPVQCKCHAYPCYSDTAPEPPPPPLLPVRAHLAEVALHDLDHLQEELEHHGGVDVLLGDGRQPDVGALDVEEGGARDVGDRRADLPQTVTVRRRERWGEVREKLVTSERTCHRR